MKNFLILTYILLSAIVFGQNRASIPSTPSSLSMKAGAFIDVNSAGYAQSNYTITQLITDVLINGGSNCTANVSNVTVSPNLAVTNNNRSWGYFNKGNTAFPFNDGIILMTGYARRAGNTLINTTLSDPLGTGGDTDLANAIGVNNNRLADATTIEFDFVPVTNQISFNYLFASEEYSSTSNFACNYTDGFALLIKKVGDPTYTNLAVLPNGGGPVSTTNIHGPLSCGSANPQYYAGNNTANIETNFNGRTVPLTAFATVIPGQTYHFKMVLADASLTNNSQDTAFDTGVFLQAGSFNIGVQLNDGSGNPLPTSTSICAGSSQLINANVQTTGATYQWLLNGSPISGAVNPTYSATTSGIYTVQVLIPGSTCPGTAQITVNVIPNPVVQNAVLSQCTSATTSTFNLTSAQANINTATGSTFSYYVNQADAIAANTNTIATPTAYTSGNATIFVLVKNGNCKSIAQLQLILEPIPATPTITASSTTLCANGTVTLTSSATTGNTWSNGATTPSITVSTAGTYTLTTTNGNCTSTAATITINTQVDPNVQITGNLVFCTGNNTTLTATANGTGNTFLWSNGAATAATTVTTGGNYTVTVTTAAGCIFTKSVTVQADTPPNVTNTTLSVCSSSTTGTFNLTSAQANINTATGSTFSFYVNQADAIAANTNTIANPTTYNSGNATIYVVVKNGNCKSIAELQLIVEPIPATPTITASSTTLCANGTVTLTSSATTGNTWSNGATTPTITVSTAGTYTLTTTNGNCTSTAATITINTQVDPNVQITGNLVFCTGNNTTLTATANGTGNTFLWSNGAATAATTVTTGGNYTVTVTTAAGCIFTKSVTVQVDSPPNAQNATLVVCSNTATGTFDLTTAQPSITTVTGSIFSYYVNLADANAGNTNTIATPTAYTSGNATIYVLVKKGTCSQVVQLQLTVTQTIVPTITASNTVICGNNSITLTSNFATGNTWSTGATTQTITVSTAGTYTLTYTGSSCTSTPASITITKNDNPDVQITGNLSFCTGSSTTLTVTALGTGNTYLWSNGATTATINVSTPGTYTVTVTTSGGCPFPKSVTVTQNPVPTTTNSTLSKCSLTTTADFDLTSAQTAISTSPGITFSYYTNLADATAGAANFIVNPTNYNSSTAIIYVRVSNANCFKVAELQLTVTITPTPTISQNAPAICAGTPVVLSSNYPTGNVWSTGATTQNITVSTAGTYSLIVNNGNCPSQSVAVTILDSPNPNVQISGVLSFCQGNFTTLTASSTGTGNTYLWNNGTATQTLNVNAAGTYTVTVTTPAGCVFTKSVTVTQEPVITISIAQPGQINCTTPTVTLNASASTFQAGSTILWTATGGGNIVSGANTLTPIVNAGGTYTLTITNTTGLHCSQQTAIIVTQNSIPPTISVSAPKTTICAGESVLLTANGAATYTFTGLPGTGSTQSVSPTTTTTYTVTGIGANGCQGNTATITIYVVPAIVSTIKDIQFCKGLNGVLDAGTGPNYTYLWSTGATTQTITVNIEGVFNVTINNGVCSKNFAATVNYTAVPVLDEIVYEKNNLIINVKPPIPANLEYSINGGINWQDSNIFTNVLPNLNYTILVRVKGEFCYATIEFYTFYVKNIITPNSDGINDEIDFSGVSQYENFSAAIYDRYGKEIFRATPNNTKWNGSYIKLDLPTASYWYSVSWLDPISNKPIQRNGWILLKNRD